ncbi:MAG TPA: ring-cleaving dioxygenase [Vicinamibacterales bacterium]|nr:ring-cleaving dioxygenase [Vicinamibacterales bacterium]
MAVNGLHHITAISGPAQENLDFYAGVLGMRLVKKSVNQDDPGTYHLFYADAEGRPGTDLTFFPWAQMAPPREGHGRAMEVSLEVPSGSLGYWSARLENYGASPTAIESRFGDRVLPLVDPHGLRLALVEAARHARQEFTPWDDSPVAAEHQVRGLYGAQAWERDAAATAQFLTGALGFTRIGDENGWTRYGFASAAGVLDIREMRDQRRGEWGVGSVHHLAWRVDDDQHQLRVRDDVESAGAGPTPVIDRFWFKSVYFKEPGGVLFEIATDGPGFAVDEDPAHLGESLVLPPFLERQRAAIERVLPVLKHPTLTERV